jgi:hypothetical protein
MGPHLSLVMRARWTVPAAVIAAFRSAPATRWWRIIARRRGTGRGWVVHDIGIAVMALRHHRRLDDRVGAQDTTQAGVVHAPVHVHEAEVVQHFMPGVAASGEFAFELGASGDLAGVIAAIHIAPLAEHVVAEALDRRAGLVGSDLYGTEVVGVEVMGW